MAGRVSYLVVMGLTVRQALPLVVPMAKKRLLTLGAHKMLSTEKPKKKPNYLLGEKDSVPGHLGSFQVVGTKV